MSVADDPKTFGRSRLSFASDAEIDEFVSTLERFERGDLTPDQWRQFRLVRGTYGQRQTDDAQMVRVKIPQGVLTADQLEAILFCTWFASAIPVEFPCTMLNKFCEAHLTV